MASAYDEQSVASSVIICSTIMMVLSTLCMTIRLYTRFYVTGNPGWDDGKLADRALAILRLI